jgi:hypothetical protein
VLSICQIQARAAALGADLHVALAAGDVIDDGTDLGFSRVVASEIEAPSLFVNAARGG